MAKLERITEGEITELVPLKDVICVGTLNGEIKAHPVLVAYFSMIPPTGEIEVRTDLDTSSLPKDKFFGIIDAELKKNKLYFKVEEYFGPSFFSSHRLKGRFYKEREHHVAR